MELGFDKDEIKKYYYAIAVGAGIFVGIIILSFVLSGLYKQSKKLTDEMNEKTNYLTQLQDRKKILDDLSSREDELKKDAAALSSALPDSKDIGRLFIQLNGLITDSGGSVKGIAGGGTGDSGTGTSTTITSSLRKYSFTLPVNLQNYEAVKSLLTKTKKVIRLMDVSSISMSSPDGGKMDATVTINTYSRN